jgi:Coenzyme PQQ synthesis protein D (PqqD)
MGGLAVARLSLDASLSPNPEVVSREVEGELVLLDLESATYFGLNHVGSRVWTLVGELGSLRKVCETMEREYAVPREQLERDVLGLARELRDKGLLVVTREGR